LFALLWPLLLSWEAKKHGHHGRHCLADGLGLLLLPHVELHHLLLVMSELLLLHQDDLLVIRVLLFNCHFTLNQRHHGHHSGECCHRVDWLSNLRSLGLCGGLFCFLFVFLRLLSCLLFFGRFRFFLNNDLRNVLNDGFRFFLNNHRLFNDSLLDR